MGAGTRFRCPESSPTQVRSTLGDLQREAGLAPAKGEKATPSREQVRVAAARTSRGTSRGAAQGPPGATARRSKLIRPRLSSERPGGGESVHARRIVAQQLRRHVLEVLVALRRSPVLLRRGTDAHW